MKKQKYEYGKYSTTPLEGTYNIHKFTWTKKNRPASFILTKNTILFSTHSDSHDEIIKEFNLLHDDIVRVIVSPPNNDLRMPLDTWVYHLDHNGPLPDWYDAFEAQKRASEALRAWAEAKLVLTGQRVATSGQLYVCSSDVVVEARGSAMVWAYGSAHIEVRVVEPKGRIYIEAHNSAHVRAHAGLGEVHVRAYDSAHMEVRVVEPKGRIYIEAHNSAHVKAFQKWRQSLVVAQAYDSAYVEAHNLALVVAYDSSKVKRTKSLIHTIDVSDSNEYIGCVGCVFVIASVIASMISLIYLCYYFKNCHF